MRYSITWSARASSAGGMVRSSILAVWRLITSSNLGGLLGRQVARFGALENSVDVARRLSKLINGIRTV
jgi:hypothetical protein